jgi:hypothetical protein
LNEKEREEKAPPNFLLLLCPRLVSLHMLNHHKHPLLLLLLLREKIKEEYQRGEKAVVTNSFPPCYAEKF